MKVTNDEKPVEPSSPKPKKPGKWSRFLQALGEAIGQAKFGS